MEIKFSDEFFTQHQRLILKRLEEVITLKEKCQYHLQRFSETGDMHDLAEYSRIYTEAMSLAIELQEQTKNGLVILMSQEIEEG